VINSGVCRDSVTEPVLYLLCIVNLSVALDETTATYADDTALLMAHNNHIEAFKRKSFLHSDFLHPTFILMKSDIRINSKKCGSQLENLKVTAEIKCSAIIKVLCVIMKTHD
jgi:hypothetical protein